MKNKEQGLTSPKTKIYFSQFQIRLETVIMSFIKLISNSNRPKILCGAPAEPATAKHDGIRRSCAFRLFLLFHPGKSLWVKTDTTNNTLLSNYTLN